MNCVQDTIFNNFMCKVTQYKLKDIVSIDNDQVLRGTLVFFSEN